MDADLDFIMCEVSQSYAQSETPTQVPIFVRPPLILKLGTSPGLRAKRPLCGILKAGLQWFRSHHNHHRQRMSLSGAVHDPCFLYIANGVSYFRQSSSLLLGFISLQADNTAYVGNQPFIAIESSVSKRLDTEKQKFVTEQYGVTFSEAEIRLANREYLISQADQTFQLSTVNGDLVDKAKFVAQRAQIAYIAAICRLDRSFGFAQASQIINLEKAAAKSLYRLIE